MEDTQIFTEYHRLFMEADRKMVSPKKVEQAAAVLQESLTDAPSTSAQAAAERHGILQLLGATHAVQHRQMVKAFLDFKDEPWTVRRALETLCEHCGDTWKYADLVYSFLSPVPWDEEEIVRFGAICIAGEYMRSGHDPRMLQKLIDIVVDETEDGETRGTAYYAVAVAMGTPEKRIPAMDAKKPLARIKETVLEEARRRVQDEEAV